MKIRFAGLEVDDKMTVSELAHILAVHNKRLTLNIVKPKFTFEEDSIEPTAQELIDSC